VLSALPILVLGMSAIMKLMRNPELLEMWTGSLGYREATLLPIALVEIGCAAIYAVPQTAILGAVLLTGYLGGAIATHVRIGESFLIPLGLGLAVWAGIYLRCGRLRAILPVR
jgi:hypothetical protein